MSAFRQWVTACAAIVYSLGTVRHPEHLTRLTKDLNECWQACQKGPTR